MSKPPWVTGPAEILQHGLSLLKKDSDVNRRLAMIGIDNAVELMIKTYLGLPSRVTGIKIGRDKFRDISESFPKLLDALEEHAPSRLDGINLGEIEWFHRLRNELYHQGNGLTVEREKVEVYAQLARLLFKNLFDVELEVHEDNRMELLGSFMSEWSHLERLVFEDASRRGGTPRPAVHSLRSLYERGVIDPHTARELEDLRRIRNALVHHGSEQRSALSPELVERVKALRALVEQRLPTPPAQAAATSS